MQVQLTVVSSFVSECGRCAVPCQLPAAEHAVSSTSVEQSVSAVCSVSALLLPRVAYDVQHCVCFLGISASVLLCSWCRCSIVLSCLYDWFLFFFCLYFSSDDNRRLLFIVATLLFFFLYASSSFSLRLMLTRALSLFCIVYASFSISRRLVLILDEPRFFSL